MAAELYLITPRIADAGAFAPELQAALAGAPVAALLLKLAGTDEKDVLKAAKVLVPVVQAAGAAVLLDAPADPRLVARAGADGAHMPAGREVGEVISALRPARIVGVGGLKSRHEAMEAGERDLDYVMFGEPHADGYVPETERTVERAEWWARIFNLPCVAYAGSLEAIPALVRTGAEFIALGPWLFEAADPAATLREAHSLITTHSPAR